MNRLSLRRMVLPLSSVCDSRVVVVFCNGIALQNTTTIDIAIKNIKMHVPVFTLSALMIGGVKYACFYTHSRSTLEIVGFFLSIS